MGDCVAHSNLHVCVAARSTSADGGCTRATASVPARTPRCRSTTENGTKSKRLYSGSGSSCVPSSTTPQVCSCNLSPQPRIWSRRPQSRPVHFAGFIFGPFAPQSSRPTADICEPLSQMISIQMSRASEFFTALCSLPRLPRMASTYSREGERFFCNLTTRTMHKASTEAKFPAIARNTRQALSFQADITIFETGFVMITTGCPQIKPTEHFIFSCGDGHIIPDNQGFFTTNKTTASDQRVAVSVFFQAFAVREWNQIIFSCDYVDCAVASNCDGVSTNFIQPQIIVVERTSTHRLHQQLIER